MADIELRFLVALAAQVAHELSGEPALQ